jgi:PAS domain S-box-containing protein
MMPPADEGAEVSVDLPPPSEDRFRLLVEGVRDYAIFMLDPHGRIVTWNAGAERIKGYGAEEIIGQNFARFYPHEALRQDVPARELEMAAATGVFQDEGWRIRKDGTRFWASVVITALRDQSGELLGFSKITRDLTQRRSHDETLRLSEERFRLLVEGVSEYAIFMLDPNGVVITWNSGAERIKGYSASDIIGQHFSKFYPADAIESGWPEYELQVAAETGRFVDEGWRLRKDGSTFWANVTITALREPDTGRLLGFAKLTRDQSERRRVEELEVEGRRREEALEGERSARIAAQRAIRIKDEFLATLSHELRTPMSAIVGWTQVLRRKSGTMSPEELHHAIEVIDRNAAAQLQLINDLLDLNRIMSGKVRLDLQQVSVAEVVRSAIESAEPAARNKDLRLQVVLDPHPITVSADSGRLQQVVWNLVTNAIKFTPKGGRIEVVLQRVGSHIELSVSDTGVGIPASFLPHVFDRFSQRDSSAARSFGGLGLGLAISKQLVELHGGTIRAKSLGEGLGATFFVDLPMSIMQPRGDEESPGHPTREESSGEPVALPRLIGVHVLVVDDEPDARDLLRRVLEEQGAIVTTATSGEEALQTLSASPAHVIVSDIGMPLMDGYQFMRSLRSTQSRGERIPAIALTAFARAEDRKKCLLAGYQAHLAKPFDLAELVLTVADLAQR